MIEVLVLDHARGDIVAELFHLPSNISKESIARPSSNDHDCIDGNIVQVHGHRCSTECVPMSFILKPSISSPMSVAAARRVNRM